MFQTPHATPFVNNPHQTAAVARTIKLMQHTSLRLHHRNQLRRGHTKTVPVPEEQHALGLTSSALGRLDPVAHASTSPHRLEKANGATFDVGAVVAAHDGLDGLGGLAGVVEGDGGDVVVQDVCLDDVVEDVWADGPEVAVDCGGGTTGEGPCLAGVVGESGVGVLEEGDCDCRFVSVWISRGVFTGYTHQASG